jgi:hypothetical protein
LKRIPTMPCSFATEKSRFVTTALYSCILPQLFVCHGVCAGWFQESTCCSSWDKLGNPTWWRTSELREPVKEKDLGEEAGNPGGIEPRPGEGWKQQERSAPLLHYCRVITPKWPGILLLGSSRPGCRAPSHTPTELAPLTLKPWPCTLQLCMYPTLPFSAPILLPQKHHPGPTQQHVLNRSRVIQTFNASLRARNWTIIPGTDGWIWVV